MEPIKISTGMVSVDIIDDFGEVRGVFKFNPEDLGVMKRMLELKNKIQSESSENEKKESECKTGEERMLFLEKICTDYKNQIDNIWGTGTSNILFGDAVCLTMFSDFLAGVGKCYEDESQKRINKYKKQIQDYKKKLATNKK